MNAAWFDFQLGSKLIAGHDKIKLRVPVHLAVDDSKNGQPVWKQSRVAALTNPGKHPRTPELATVAKLSEMYMPRAAGLRDSTYAAVCGT